MSVDQLMKQLKDEGPRVATALRTSNKGPKPVTFDVRRDGKKLVVKGWQLCELVFDPTQGKGVEAWRTGCTFILAENGEMYCVQKLQLIQKPQAYTDNDGVLVGNGLASRLAHEQAIEGLKKLAKSVA